MGSKPKPVDANATASTQAYQGLSRGENIHLFVAVLRQLQSRHNKACGTAETFAFLDPLLLMVEKLKTSSMSVLYMYDLNRSLYAQNGG